MLSKAAVGVFLGVVFGLLAALHVFWALGGRRTARRCLCAAIDWRFLPDGILQIGEGDPTRLPSRSPEAPRPRGRRHGHRRAGQRRELRRPLANPLVLGQDDPAVLADQSEPVFVRRIRRTVLVVHLDRRSHRAEGRGHSVPAQGPVEEEDGRARQPRRRARSGSLPRSQGGRARSPSRARRRIRRPCSARRASRSGSRCRPAPGDRRRCADR